MIIAHDRDSMKKKLIPIIQIGEDTLYVSEDIESIRELSSLVLALKSIEGEDYIEIMNTLSSLYLSIS